jgi:hypothetical protein
MYGTLNVKFANRSICRYTTFHQNRTLNIESTDVSTSTSPSNLCLSLSRFFTKLTVAERDYVTISGIEYHRNRSRNTEIADGHFCQHLQWSVTPTELTSRNTRTFNNFVKNGYTEFHENMAKGSVANVSSQICGWREWQARSEHTANIWKCTEHEILHCLSEP